MVLKRNRTWIGLCLPLLLVADCTLVSQDCIRRDLTCGEAVLSLLARQANMPPSLSVLDLSNAAITSGSTKNLGPVGRGVSGTYKDVVLRFNNSGGQSLSLANVSVSPSSQFVITAQPALSVPGGTSTTMTIRYTPSAGASDTAQFSMTTNDAQNAAFSLTLGGNGVNVGTGLLVYLPFDGSLNDMSGNGFNGVYVGTAGSYTTNRHGTTGTAALIDGLGNYIQSAPASPWAWNTTFSVSLWVLTNQTNFSVLRRGHNGPFTTQFDFGFLTTNLIIFRDDFSNTGWTSTSAAASFQPGQWQHFVFVSAASNVTIYLNGVSVGTGTISGAGGPGGGSGVLDFGSGLQLNPVGGSLDDVRIYNGVALTAAQVQALYNQD